MTWHKPTDKPIELMPLLMWTSDELTYEGHYVAPFFWAEDGYRQLKNIIQWRYDQHTAKGTIYITEEYP